jgi:hypothetical protein
MLSSGVNFEIIIECGCERTIKIALCLVLGSTLELVLRCVIREGCVIRKVPTFSEFRQC